MAEGSDVTGDEADGVAVDAEETDAVEATDGLQVTIPDVDAPEEVKLSKVTRSELPGMLLVGSFVVLVKLLEVCDVRELGA